jgi:hypothetical protein
MSSKHTLGWLVGLGFAVALLASGPAHAIGNEQHGMHTRTLQAAPAASYYTPQALKAQGLRWQAMARAYARRTDGPSVRSAGTDSGFDWNAAGLGAVGGFALAGGAAAAIFLTRRSRRANLAL